MFYQEALPKPLRLKKPNQQIDFCLQRHVGAYFRMGAYKCNVVVVIKIGAYIHGFLFCVDAYYPDFTVFIF